jgi:hypothetical protein
MKQQFLESESKAEFKKLVRICGYGVPSLERALYCAANSLTLVSEATLQPFDKRESRYVTKDMHLYSLPWPSDILLDLGEAPVKMRVTLSYFVDPSPGSRGWRNRYSYASHGLRFEVKRPLETERDFLKRVNEQAREEGENRGDNRPENKWVIGEKGRNAGSIHSDIWQGTAADLAGSNLIAVYPTTGWWKDRPRLERWNRPVRYSLLVSILAPEQQVDIYTPVAIQVAARTPITITVGGDSQS